MMASQTLLIVVLCLLTVCLIFMLGLAIFLMIKISTLPKETAKETIKEKVIEADVIRPINVKEEKIEESLHCLNHKVQPSAGICLICEQTFCEECLREDENKYFCKDHFKTYTYNKWTQISEIKTTPDTPYEALNIYHFKRHKWLNEKVPSFIVTHYKIDTENDIIESYVQLNVMEKDAEILEKELKNYKGQD